MSVEQARKKKNRTGGSRRIAPLRDRAEKNQANLCFICGEYMGDDVTAEHIFAYSLTGKHNPWNIKATHKECNKEKAKMDRVVFSGERSIMKKCYQIFQDAQNKETYRK